MCLACLAGYAVNEKGLVILAAKVRVLLLRRLREEHIHGCSERYRMVTLPVRSADLQ